MVVAFVLRLTPPKTARFPSFGHPKNQLRHFVTTFGFCFVGSSRARKLPLARCPPLHSLTLGGAEAASCPRVALEGRRGGSQLLLVTGCVWSRKAASCF
jgi:hypothetical protein